MTKLYDAGYGTDPEQIDSAVIDGFGEIKLKDPHSEDTYTFKNINVQKNKNGDSIPKFKEAILSNRSILSKVYADVYRQEGPDGKVSRVASKVRIASMPQMLGTRGTFVVKGSDYNIVNQLRKNPAPYLSYNAHAERPVTATFNLSKGRNFAIELEPKTSTFYVIMGTANILLKALAIVLDITKEDLEKVLGKDMTEYNWDNINPAKTRLNLNKLYKKLFEYKSDNPASYSEHELIALLQAYFKKTTMDPNTTEMLYGKRLGTVNRETLLTVLEEYMAVYKKEKAAPNQDELYYQRIFTPNLLFKDRIHKTVKNVEKSLSGRMYRMKREGGKVDYNKAFKSIYSQPLISMVTSTGLARLDPQYNPFGIMTAPSALTPLGIGGVNDIMAIRASQRDIQTSSMGIIDPLVSPQGQSSGLLLRTTNNFKVDKEGYIHMHVTDKKGKDNSYVPLADLRKSYIALPDIRPNTKKKTVAALHNGKIVHVGKEKLNHFFVNGPEDTLNAVSNLLPMANAVQGNRNFMSTRQITQSLPLAYREAPLIQTESANGENFYNTIRDKMESFMPFKSHWDGKVMSVKAGSIVIKDKKGKKHLVEYSKHLPLATNTGIHQTPIVHKGDRVKKGQMILKDNYTTPEGKIAFGVNLRTAFMPYRGHNSEDSVVISERAANKLTSVHYYKYDVMMGEPNIISKKSYLNIYPNKYTAEQLKAIQEDGIIVANTTVKEGDPLVLVISKVNPDAVMQQLGRISKDITVSMSDASILYDHPFLGEVIEVSSKSNVLTVTVKTMEMAGRGDKVAGMYGNKGVVSTVLPNKEMPRTPDGDIIDLIYAASVVPSRMNPAQIHEQALAKIVKLKKRKKPYVFKPLTNPGDAGMVDFVKKEQAKHRIKDKDILFDPVTKKNLASPVANGVMYTMKLLKGDKDFSARGVGPSYSSNMQPTKGGHEGAKAIGQAEFYSLVAHNARNVLNDMSTVKGQFSPDYWRQLLYGSPPIPTSESFAFQRFKASLTSAGAVYNATKDGYQLLPLTDKLTTQLAGHRTIETPALLRGKTLEPIKKGLYDKATTGGVDGALWSKIELSDGMISPLVESYVAILLGMTKAEIREWEASHTTAEMKKELSKIDVKKKIRELKKKSKEKGKLDNSELKLLRFLRNLEDKGTVLTDLIITAIPVSPPKYRPLTQLGDGNIQLADVNHFYKDVMLSNDGVEEMLAEKLPEASKLAKEELIYSVHALVGTEKTKNNTLKNKGTKNLLDSIGGRGSPKQSFVHGNLIKKNQDLAGRARIIPNANLDMDEVGLPIDMAKKMYEPFVKKRLVSSGMTPVNAAKEIHRDTPAARRALIAEVDARPVLLNRAPTLHRFGFLGAKPRLVTGHSIQIPLEVTQGYNADFDGDAMQVHVPVSAAAVQEAKKLVASENLLGDVSPDRVIMGIMPETVLGFYNKAQHDLPGLKADLRKLLPKEVDLPRTYDKPGIKNMFVQVIKNKTENMPKVLHQIKVLGDEYATMYPTTVGVDDIDSIGLKRQRDRILDSLESKLKKMEPGTKEYAMQLESSQKKMMELAKDIRGGIGDMLRAKAKGSDNQVSGMILSPVISYNPNNPLETAHLTRGSYADGLNYEDFFRQVGKTRTDAVKTALSVALPGSLSKLLTAAVNRMVITVKDCETEDGVTLYPGKTTSTIQGSLLAAATAKYKRNDIITASMAKELLAGEKPFKIRSPRTCEASEGVCSMCYGVDSRGALPSIGTHVGVQIAHGVSEPMAQVALDSKHGGRSITKDVNQGGLVDLTKTFSSNNEKSGMAVIVQEDSVVESIDKLPSGANKVTMKDGTDYILAPDLTVTVKKGSHVMRGKAISSGIVPFTDVIRARGIVAGREALTEQFEATMAKNGATLSKRVYDLIGRAAVDYVKVFSDLGEIVTGDTVNYNTFKKEMAKIGVLKKIDLVQEGTQLSEEFGDLSAGTILTAAEAQSIRSSKTIPGTTRTFVRIANNNIPIEWVDKTIYTAGLVDDDWVHHIGSRYIKRNILAATSEGNVSKKKTLSPVNVWMRGKKMSTDPNSPYYEK